MVVDCPRCNDSGMESVFLHLSFPAHTPNERRTNFETFEPLRQPRRWEDGDGILHRLYATFRICACPAGDQRTKDVRDRKETKQRRRGFDPSAG